MSREVGCLMNCRLLAEELLKAENIRDEVVFKKAYSDWVAVLGTEATGQHRNAVTLRLSTSRDPDTSSRQVADELLKTPEMVLIMPDASGGWIEVLGVMTLHSPRWSPAIFVLATDMGGIDGVIEYHEWEEDP